jgi:hypothetical protein
VSELNRRELGSAGRTGITDIRFGMAGAVGEGSNEVVE